MPIDPVPIDPVPIDPVQIDPGQIDPGPIDALARARAGDGRAFQELTGPYLGELQLHCYRVLGSLADAEDVMQETLLAAWRGAWVRRTGLLARLVVSHRHQPVPERVAGRWPAPDARSLGRRRSHHPSPPAGENQCG